MSNEYNLDALFTDIELGDKAVAQAAKVGLAFSPDLIRKTLGEPLPENIEFPSAEGFIVRKTGEKVDLIRKDKAVSTTVAQIGLDRLRVQYAIAVARI